MKLFRKIKTYRVLRVEQQSYHRMNTSLQYSTTRSGTLRRREPEQCAFAIHDDRREAQPKRTHGEIRKSFKKIILEFLQKKDVQHSLDTMYAVCWFAIAFPIVCTAVEWTCSWRCFRGKKIIFQKIAEYSYSTVHTPHTHSPQTMVFLHHKTAVVTSRQTMSTKLQKWNRFCCCYGLWRRE